MYCSEIHVGVGKSDVRPHRDRVGVLIRKAKISQSVRSIRTQRSGISDVPFPHRVEMLSQLPRRRVGAAVRRAWREPRVPRSSLCWELPPGERLQLHFQGIIFKSVAFRRYPFILINLKKYFNLKTSAGVTWVSPR